MAKYIKCPAEHPGRIEGGPSIFLAGGITNCPDWQSDAEKYLSPLNVTIVNPRRENWDYNAGNDLVREQIIWEHKHLHMATQILFWFPKETLCPITLFELGNHLPRPMTIWLGCHPEYQRILDVEVQTSLIRPKHVIYKSLEEMCSVMVKTMSPAKAED